MFKAKVVIGIGIIVLILTILTYMAVKQTKKLERDPVVLFNKYYLFKDKNPEAAEQALHIILHQDENNLSALKELSEWHIHHQQPQLAIPPLEKMSALLPDDENVQLRLAHLYFATGQWDKAYPLLIALKNYGSPLSQQIAKKQLLSMASTIPYYKTYSVVPSVLRNETVVQNTILTPILFGFFYKLKETDINEAERLLVIIQYLQPDNILVNEEMGYLALRANDIPLAINNFMYAYNLKPSAQLASQLGYLLLTEHRQKEAADFFLIAAQIGNKDEKRAALKAYNVTLQMMTPSAQSEYAARGLAPTGVQVPAGDPANLLLDEFYSLQKRDQGAAWTLIQKIIAEYPANLVALKEGGYLAITMKQRAMAIKYFTSAYNISYQADLAMQLGYLYNLDEHNHTAYHYFKLATDTTDAALALRAQNAMTNLAGHQTKIFPEPYFGEIFFDPFTQSRFGLTVRPLMIRLGIENNNKFQNKEYLVFRRTDDNKTLNTGQIPQIYEDNVEIIGVGLQVTPIPKFPLVGYVEAGEAYDLVYRNRKRWRGDLRGGLMYYNEFGARPAYFDKFKFSKDYYSELYIDSNYFSRYNNNIISTIRTRQGIRAIQYESTMINFYVTGRVIADTNRDFFNNIAEIGPGIAIVPSNRYNLQLRLEQIRGVYLPVNRFSVNPYGKYYTNRIAQLLVYVRI